jgi:hypothetical protein
MLPEIVPGAEGTLHPEPGHATVFQAPFTQASKHLVSVSKIKRDTAGEAIASRCAFVIRGKSIPCAVLLISSNAEGSAVEPVALIPTPTL